MTGAVTKIDSVSVQVPEATSRDDQVSGELAKTTADCLSGARERHELTIFTWQGQQQIVYQDKY